METLVIAEFDTSVTKASVPGLTNGVDYRVTVTAVNTIGESVARESAFMIPISPPVVDPPIVDPPMVDPPIVDPPPGFLAPSAPTDIAVVSTARKFVTVEWRIENSVEAPVIDFIVHVSRHKNRGFTVWPDALSANPRVELQKPRRGALYIRVIAVTSWGESVPSEVKRVAR
jgi:hypothetical protein